MCFKNYKDEILNPQRTKPEAGASHEKFERFKRRQIQANSLRRNRPWNLCWLIMCRRRWCQLLPILWKECSKFGGWQGLSEHFWRRAPRSWLYFKFDPKALWLRQDFDEKSNGGATRRSFHHNQAKDGRRPTASIHVLFHRPRGSNQGQPTLHASWRRSVRRGTGATNNQLS